MRKSLIALALVLAPAIAWGQNAVRQNGAVTKFDIPAWIQDHTLESGSKTFTDNARGFNPFHVYDAGGDGITFDSGLSTTLYNRFSFGHNSNGDAVITVAPMNGATNKSLFLSKNGTLYEFPFSTTGVVGPATTTAGHGACWNNTSGTLLSDCPLATGDVVGPGSAVDGDVAVFNGTTGKLLKDSGFTPSAITATTKAVAATYTVVNADNHTTLNLASGGVANQTVTIGALSGFTDTKFTVAFCNRDTRPWKIVSTDAGTLKLYPDQCNMLLPNSAGGLRYWQPFRPYMVKGVSRSLYMGPGGACNDNNDGFSADTNGQICTFTTLYNIAQGEMVCDAGGVNLVVAAGSYNQTIAVAGPPPPGCGDQLTLSGAGSTGGSTITCPAASHCFRVEDHAILTVSGFRVVCTSATGFYSRQFAVLDISDMIIGDCAGGTILAANDGHINLIDPAHPTSIQGNAAAAVNSNGSSSLVSAGGGTLTVTSSPITITNFVVASAQGQASFGPSQIPGGGAVTGIRWAADTLGLILTSSGISCDSFFNNVGGTVGAATNGGVCK